MPKQLQNKVKKHLPAIALATSLLLHLLFILSVANRPETSPRREAKPIPIEIRTIPRQASKLSPPPAKENVPSSQKAETSKKPQTTKTKDAAESRESPKNLAYKDLLPSSSEIKVEAGQESGTGKATASAQSGSNEFATGPYRAEAYQNIMIDSHSLQGIFDIPLFVRENRESAKASLELEPLSETSTMIIVLKGDPFLRALIWEKLKLPKTRLSLYRISQSMGEKTIKIHLSYASQYATKVSSKRFEEVIRLQKAEVSIQISFHKDRDFGPQMGGIPLPDKDAELAKKRDRLATSALTESKAFQRVIRNETVTN